MATSRKELSHIAQQRIMRQFVPSLKPGEVTIAKSLPTLTPIPRAELPEVTQTSKDEGVIGLDNTLARAFMVALQSHGRIYDKNIDNEAPFISDVLSTVGKITKKANETSSVKSVSEAA